MRRSHPGFIFVETLVAMGILSVSVIIIQESLRQAIYARAQSQDYTTARFLLERVAGEQALKFQQAEGSGAGRFPEPYERFSYEWEIRKVDVPRPPLPAYLEPHEREQFEEHFVDYMGMLKVRIQWRRGGADFESRGETLLRPGLLWLPEEDR